MAGLVPAIHVFLSGKAAKTWMPATSAGMTKEKQCAVLPSWPGLSRPSTPLCLVSHQDVDARDKRGHDEGETVCGSAVMAGLVPAIHASLSGEAPRRGCPRQARA